MASIRREKIDLSQEMQILINMVTSTSFLSKIQNVSNLKYFESSHSKMLCSWIWEYYGITGEAPGKNLEDIFIKKRRTIQDQDDEDMITRFLSNLSKTWDGNELKNLDFAVNSAIDYFKIQSFKALTDQLKSATMSGDAKEAENLLARYTKVDIPETDTINVLKNIEAVKEAFEERDEVLFRLPGDLGKALGPIVRGDFLGIQAPPKRGKTFTMIEIARRACLSGCKTLFVSLEMSKKQTLRRIWQNFQGKTTKPIKTTKYFVNPDDDFPELAQRSFSAEPLDLSPEYIKKQLKKYVFHTRGAGEFRLEIQPTDSFSPSDLHTLLDNLSYYENFEPDVIVIDYADIMTTDDRRLEYRHRLDDIWKKLRGLATEKNIAVITGSQGGIRKGAKDTQAEDVAEDGRKLATVTKLMIMNQTPEEKEKGFLRYSVPLSRETRVYADDVLAIQALEVSRPWIATVFCERVGYKKENIKEL